MTSTKLAREAAAGVVRAGIYTAFMVLSKRVKATFVVRLSKRGRKLEVVAST